MLTTCQRIHDGRGDQLAVCECGHVVVDEARPSHEDVGQHVAGVGGGAVDDDNDVGRPPLECGVVGGERAVAAVAPEEQYEGDDEGEGGCDHPDGDGVPQ